MNLTRKVCPPDKVLNPATSRCVSRTSKLGKSILQQPPVVIKPQQEQKQPAQPTKQCPPDKVLNPASSRCVSRTSKLGKTILQEQRMEPERLQLFSQQESTPSIQNSRSLKRRKASVIARFMKRTKHARKATALSSICSDSGLCIAFGTQSDEIKKFFHGFSSFDFVESFGQIGAASNNGFVYSVNYNHRGYIANAILKSSASPTSDNLMYEYAVGKHINQLFYYKFPIFVETYDCYYRYSSNALWQSLKSGTYTGKLKDALTPKTELDYKKSCATSKYICILVQHIKNASSLETMCNSARFIHYELINSLYQIYFTLSVIKDKFTHYDLHTDNVLVYTPRADKYIEYHFHHLSGETTTFKSKHLIKVIDYGRSFVEDVSMDARNHVCSEKKCDPKCGYNHGYWMYEKLPYNLKTWKHNNSHDLRLLYILKNDLKNVPKPAGSVEDILYKQLLTVIYNERFGTPEIIQSRQPVRIANVSDAEISLRTMIKSDVFKRVNNDCVVGLTKMGDLHVYEDGRNMEYISS